MTVSEAELSAAMRAYVDQCKQIDVGVSNQTAALVGESFTAVLEGRSTDRDHLLSRIVKLARASQQAKLEIGYRIAEMCGCDRDAMELEVEARLKAMEERKRADQN